MHLRVVDSEADQPKSSEALMPQPQAIFLPSPENRKAVAPASRRTVPTSLAVRATPCQLFPTISGSKPRPDATARPARFMPALQNRLTMPHAVRPRQFISGFCAPLY